MEVERHDGPDGAEELIHGLRIHLFVLAVVHHPCVGLLVVEHVEVVVIYLSELHFSVAFDDGECVLLAHDQIHCLHGLARWWIVLEEEAVLGCAVLLFCH